MDHERELTVNIAVAVLEGAIRSGDIQLDGQTDAEVFQAYSEFTREIIEDTDVAIEIEISHGDDLLKEAAELAKRRNPNLAIVVYATWVEHWLNGMIATALERRDFARNERKPVLLCNLDAKIGWLWRLLFEEQFPQHLAVDIRRIANARNAFVHYKWPAVPDDESRAELREICNLAPTLVKQLGDLQEEIHFKGQRDRIRRIVESNIGSNVENR